jgi:hypothetical protein
MKVKGEENVVATWLSRFSLFLAFCQGGFILDLTTRQGTGTEDHRFWQSRVYRLGPKCRRHFKAVMKVPTAVFVVPMLTSTVRLLLDGTCDEPFFSLRITLGVFQ